MVEESKKTGNCYNFEPLRQELNDTFGCMKNVTPDSVFSTLKGLQVKPNSDSTETTEDGPEDETPLVSPSTSSTTNNNDEKKKPSKSM